MDSSANSADSLETLKVDLNEAVEKFEENHKLLKVLVKKKYILQEISQENIAQIIRKMKLSEFALMNRSSKWVKSFIEENRDAVILSINYSLCLDCDNIEDTNLGWIDEFTKNKNFFRLKKIEIVNFVYKVEFLKSVLQKFEGKQIYAEKLRFKNSPIVEELFSVFNIGKYVFEKATNIEIIPVVKCQAKFILDNEVDLKTVEDTVASKFNTITFYIELSKELIAFKITSFLERFLMTPELIDHRMSLRFQTEKFHLLRGEFKNSGYRVFEKLYGTDDDRSEVFVAFKASPIGFATAILIHENYNQKGNKLAFARHFDSYENFQSFFIMKKINVRNWLKRNGLSATYDPIRISTSKWFSELDPKNEGKLVNFFGERLKSTKQIKILPQIQPIENNQRWKSLVPWPTLSTLTSLPEMNPLILVENNEEMCGAERKLALEKYLTFVNCIIDTQVKWICLLNKGKYLNCLLDNLILEVIKKMKLAAFIRTMRANKWMNGIIKDGRSSYIKEANTRIIHLPIQDQLGWIDYLDSMNNFYFKTITIKTDRDRYSGRYAPILRRRVTAEVLEKLRNKRIRTENLILRETVISQELLNTFDPVNVTVISEKHDDYPNDFAYSRRMKRFTLHARNNLALETIIDKFEVGKVSLDLSFHPSQRNDRVAFAFFKNIAQDIRDAKGKSHVFITIRQALGKYDLNDLPKHEKRMLYKFRKRDTNVYFFVEKCGEGVVAIFYTEPNINMDEVFVCKYVESKKEYLDLYKKFNNAARFYYTDNEVELNVVNVTVPNEFFSQN